MNRRVLVFEQDEDLARQVCFALRDPGLDPVGVSEPAQVLRMFYAYRPSLVLLDIDAQGFDPWELCRRMRDLAETPIIVTSADSQRDTLLKGYEVGVDGFVVKPFAISELVGHVARVMQHRVNGDSVEFPPPFQSDGLTINWSQHEVKVQGKKVDLTPTEFKLLRCLAENPNRILSHEQILSKVWGAEYISDKSYVKLYVRYLREKIEPKPSQPTWIVTERGFGYKFVPSMA